MSAIPNYTTISPAQHKFSLPEDGLANRTVLITGATGGLGTVLCKACAAAGATVIITGRNMKKLEALYDVLDELGNAQPAIVPLNQETAAISEYSQVVDILSNEFGQLDALVHTAAELGKLTPLQVLAQEDWSRVMAVNLDSARMLTSACLPLLRNAPQASVVFTLDNKQSAYWGAYGISKAAVQSLALMYADETESNRLDNIVPQLAINGIDPGPMRTALRRRAFPGELESESPTPDNCVPPFLSLIARADPMLTGSSLCIQESVSA